MSVVGSALCSQRGRRICAVFEAAQAGELSTRPPRNVASMRPVKTLLACCSIVAVLWLGTCAISGSITAEWALRPGRLPLRPTAEAEATSIASQAHATLQSIAIPAQDGAVLQAWYLRPVIGNDDAVILLHGQGDNRAGMLGTADLLLRHGYSVLTPDARGQGTSGGALVTYGVLEADDIRRWFEWLARAQAARCIDGLGESMGAGELLQSLKSVAGFCAAVAESPFASFTEAAYDRIGERLGTGPWLGRTLLRPVVWSGLLYARLLYGVDLAASAPGEAVARSRVPILLIHGLKDDNLPPRHSEMILAESRKRNENVILWEPLDAGHCGAAGAEPDEYERRVIGWLDAHHTPPPLEPVREPIAIERRPKM